jgi:hypothetical protein
VELDGLGSIVPSQFVLESMEQIVLFAVDLESVLCQIFATAQIRLLVINVKTIRLVRQI